MQCYSHSAVCLFCFEVTRYQIIKTGISWKRLWTQKVNQLENSVRNQKNKILEMKDKLDANRECLKTSPTKVSCNMDTVDNKFWIKARTALLMCAGHLLSFW